MSTSKHNPWKKHLKRRDMCGEYVCNPVIMVQVKCVDAGGQANPSRNQTKRKKKKKKKRRMATVDPKLS